ncbi:efflux RND transporter periplasmic adaptor subunit [Janthinobacterium fluminis]|uniref:Efflux RND transporter periplasmic adaptor subunit n=1 Tax=Janthinobacterium fluminis TaxID=2987524 RepID=A0ABT5K675_9BURK|nr:efflux RND transporter periplasmic adaptor subunit [Janthinobacterium fluminis]MDC8760281.1 efflux RND transporter periplasmic adaptor subunit [Janthinobacterium fluminis]
MKKTSLGLLVGAAVCIGAGVWYWTHGGAAPAADKGGAAVPAVVTVVKPQRQDVPVLLRANGSVTPVSSVDLHPQTSSTVSKVHIREGQFVKAGELMFSLDARSEQAGVEQAQAQVARDRATLADFERQYRRSLELLDKHFIAQGAVDTLKSQVESARALLQADVAALRSVQVGASYTTIRAPMAGRVGAIGVYPGSLVQPATSLTSVTQLDPINVSFTLPESALAALLAAHKAGAVPVTAELAGKQVAGALSFIDNSVDPVAGVIRLKARFDNRDESLWPGQFVNVSLTVQTLKDALVIPQNAIISNTSGVFVYTVAPDRSAAVRKVARLHAFGLNAAVSGLNGDEQVIVDGKQNLRPGAPVRVAEAAAGRKKGQAE